MQVVIPDGCDQDFSFALGVSYKPSTLNGLLVDIFLCDQLSSHSAQHGKKENHDGGFSPFWAIQNGRYSLRYTLVHSKLSRITQCPSSPAPFRSSTQILSHAEACSTASSVYFRCCFCFDNDSGECCCCCCCSTKALNFA